MLKGGKMEMKGNMLKKILSLMLAFLLAIPTFSVFVPRAHAPDYPHDPRGEITDVVIVWPTCYQGETQEIYVEFQNPTATTYHYLVVVNIYNSSDNVVYDSDLEGENIDGYINGGDTVSWGPWEYTIKPEDGVGTWHILAGLRLYPWDPELDYRGLSWCEPEENFVVKPSNEYIAGLSTGTYDYDDDGYDDSVWLEVQAGTNAEESVQVEAYGDLKDPDGNIVDNDGSGLWTVPAGGESWGYRFYLFVESGPVGRYTVDLYLYDASHRNDYPDPEYILLDAASYDPLYPEGYTPNPSTENIYSMELNSFESSGDCYHDAAFVRLNVDTTDGTLDITAYGYLYDPSESLVDSDSTTWTITGTNIEYGDLYLYVPIGGSVGRYRVYVEVYDNLGYFEDDAEGWLDPLYPPDYSPSRVELYYDDGNFPEGGLATSTLPHYKAVRFHTPSSGLYKLSYVKYFIYSDPSFFELQIRDASTQIVYSSTVTPTDVGWFIVDLTSEGICVQGDFYVAMKYLSVQQPKLAYDSSNPDVESGEGSSFPADPNISSLDWMIRAVLGENQPPTAYIDNINPNPANESETVYFSGHGSDPDGSIVDWRWESSIDGFLSSSSSFSTFYLFVGTHTISFKVKDDDGVWSTPDTELLTIEVVSGKPLAPNGVHHMVTYESRIGEQGFLFEDDNLQMWVPARYENHSRIIFGYLATGYANLSSIFGNYEYPYKFSVEHYPSGSPYLWGGTDARGTIRYGYSNLEDDTPEWNDYGVPHVVGYYEEMAHCFAYDFGVIGDGWGGGFSVGFYETLGLMIGSEVALRVAYNDYINSSISSYYQVCNETTAYYLQHNTGPPGVGNNIWPTRVLTHIFKTEVVDVYGWSSFTNTFNYLQLEDYPLKQYDRDHTWGGFLNYLGNQTSSDLNTIFAGYGLPSLQWFEGDGYKRGMMWIDDNNYSFRVKCFDREGDQPSDAKLHVYSTASSTYAMSFIEGNNETGWIFEANVTLNGPVDYTYTFSARDGAHSIFQAVGLPTLVHDIELSHDIAVTSITTSKTVVAENYTVVINVTVSNQGTCEESFNVTAYVKATVVETEIVSSLLPGKSIIITFIWNTTGFALGNYTISAIATPVPGETDTTDNIYIDGWVTITILGDLNLDGVVNILDVVYVAIRFGTIRGDPIYHPNADINYDGVIDLVDLMILGSNYGAHVNNTSQVEGDGKYPSGGNYASDKVSCALDGGNMDQDIYPFQDPNAWSPLLVYLEPQKIVFDEADVNVGYRFNVTVWVSNVTEPFGYQVALYYNSTVLNMTNAWVPSWNSSFIFYTQDGMELGPSYGNADASWEYGLIGFCGLKGAITPSADSGMLAIFEFEIIGSPPKYDSVTSDFIISFVPAAGVFKTKLLDSAVEPISFMATDGHFKYMWSPLPATVDIDPDTLNLKSRGRWITCYIELPEFYDVDDIDRATILLNGTIPVAPFWVNKPRESVVGDYDDDGIPDLIVKFSRPTVIEYLGQNIAYGNATLTVMGEFYDGTSFEGSGMIRVKMPSDVNSDCDECASSLNSA